MSESAARSVVYLAVDAGPDERGAARNRACPLVAYAYQGSSQNLFQNVGLRHDPVLGFRGRALSVRARIPFLPMREKFTGRVLGSSATVWHAGSFSPTRVNFALAITRLHRTPALQIRPLWWKNAPFFCSLDPWQRKEVEVEICREFCHLTVCGRLQRKLASL
jgi:hypothetical protein